MIQETSSAITTTTSVRLGVLVMTAVAIFKRTVSDVLMPILRRHRCCWFEIHHLIGWNRHRPNMCDQKAKAFGFYLTLGFCQPMLLLGRINSWAVS